MIYRYTVWGVSYEEIWEQAWMTARDFFGDKATLDVEIDAQAMQSTSGKILLVEADVTADNHDRP